MLLREHNEQDREATGATRAGEREREKGNLVIELRSERGSVRVFTIAQRDVLQALKRFRRLAKQDLLTSEKMPDPQRWYQHAAARRAEYSALMERVEQDGVNEAFKYAVDRYRTLPLTPNDAQEPEVRGREQALELFFLILGIDERARLRLRNARRGHRRSQGSSQRLLRAPQPAKARTPAPQ